MEEPKIVIGVCTLQYSKWMVDSLLDLVTQGEFAGWAIPESSLLPQTRNRAVQGAFECAPDFTHMLFIDDDMTGFTVNHVAKLFQDDKDIVSALCTTRRRPYKIVSFMNDKVDDKVIYEAIKNGEVKSTGACGMAFTLVKRKVFDTIREETPNKTIWFTMDRSPREGFDEEYQKFLNDSLNGDSFNRAVVKRLLSQAKLMGQNSHIGSQILGEDVSFCRRAKEAGFTCWVDCGVSVGHIGENAYDFRYAFACAEQPKEKKLH